MAVDRLKLGVSRLLEAIERMANEAGRKGLDMHPSRHYQAVDRVMEMIEAEHDTLRAENAAMRAIVEAVTERREGSFGQSYDAVLCYNDNAGYRECPWCAGSEREQERDPWAFTHEAECPVTKARALLGQWQQEHGDA